MASDRLGEFQPARVIALLNRHEVRYVLIGGLAAAMHGSPTVTVDIDICYEREPANMGAAGIGAGRSSRAPAGCP